MLCSFCMLGTSRNDQLLKCSSARVLARLRAWVTHAFVSA